MLRVGLLRAAAARGAPRARRAASSSASPHLLSRMFVPTLKEEPLDASVPSHKLLLRAGIIRQLGSGLNALLPLGLRVMERITRIVDEELQAIGCQKLECPHLQPASLWHATGRWESTGPELFRVRDRRNKDLCLAPTAEEAVSEIVRGELHSYRQLPLRLYQATSKFRDEVRPRFGLLRSREFLMKDLYSFDASIDAARQSYALVSAAYERIFARIGIPAVRVLADSGNIGGDLSHEFHLPSNTGEDVLLRCASCGYAANLERAVSRPTAPPAAEDEGAPPSAAAESRLAQLADALGLRPARELRLQAVVADGELAGGRLVVLQRGRALNPLLAKSEFPGVSAVDLATPEQLETLIARDLAAASAASPSPQRLDPLVDGSAYSNARASPCFHAARDGDGCPSCAGGVLRASRGIEVGHVFFLGTRYSGPMGLSVLDETGRRQPVQMGCYGIGLSRVLAAVVEAHHDELGIRWPDAVAPMRLAILPVAADGSGEAAAAAIKAARGVADATATVAAPSEVVIDDRLALSFSVRARDAALVGWPWVAVAGRELREKGLIELLRYGRKETRTLVAPAELTARIAGAA